jgi:hypothetical protein
MEYIDETIADPMADVIDRYEAVKIVLVGTREHHSYRKPSNHYSTCV